MTDLRTWRIELRADVAIVAKRSADIPFTYSVVLIAKRDGVWETVRSFDNAHDVMEHHDHRYLGSDRQLPDVSYGPEKTAMGSVLRAHWADIVDAWDQSR